MGDSAQGVKEISLTLRGRPLFLPRTAGACTLGCWATILITLASLSTSESNPRQLKNQRLASRIISAYK